MNVLDGVADLAVFPKGSSQWELHSKFHQTFNLINKSNQQLLLVAPENQSVVPGGLFLQEEVFFELRLLVDTFESVVIEKQTVRIETKNQVYVIHVHEGPSTRLNYDGQALVCSSQVLHFLESFSEVTGFDIALNQFIGNQGIGLLQEQTNNTLNTKDDWVGFLIGRGRGLTPSGDDFLIGWTMVEQLYGSNELGQSIKKRLGQELQQTTDISQHYLRLASKGYYGMDQLALSDVLQKKTAVTSLPIVIKNILSHGHTSGCDFLAGVVFGLSQRNKSYFRGK